MRQGLWESSGVLTGPVETLEGIANLPTMEEEDAQPREDPEMLSTLLRDTAQPVPPAYRHATAPGAVQRASEPPAARESLQAQIGARSWEGEQEQGRQAEASAGRAKARSQHAAAIP